jgi:2-haloacid dehalogenase
VEKTMISLVYFDLGGVVIKDYSHTNKFQEFKNEIGITSENNDAFDQIWNQYRYSLSIDRDVDTLIPILEKELDLKFTPDYSMLTHIASKCEPNPSLWPILTKVKENTKVGLITNVYPRMFAHTLSMGIMPELNWDIIIDSSKEKVRKPEAKIYQIAQHRAGVPGNEILFIDNKPDNLVPAQALGWHTFHYDSADYSASTRALNKNLSSLGLLEP